MVKSALSNLSSNIKALSGIGSSNRRESRDGSGSDTGSVRTGTSASSIGSEEGATRGRPLPVFGFGSARYGMLGAVDLETLDCEESDYFERYSANLRFVEGYSGGSVSDIQAGEHNVCVLVDYDVEKGGRLLCHGLATCGRLGIGDARKGAKKSWLPTTGALAGETAQPKKKDPDDEDFSSLPYETAELPYGAIVSDERARFQYRPTKVKMGKLCQVSCGQSHTVAVNARGQMWVWGSARHGRLGIGSSASEGNLPFDADDQHDTYLATPTPVEVFGVKIACVAAGLKHSLACDVSGVCYAWGLARYGRLGIEDFEKFPLEPPDVHGGSDAHSWHLTTPTIVTALQGIAITKVFAGAYNSFAIAGGGSADAAGRSGPTTLYVWGLARYGLLGMGDCQASCCFESRFDPAVGPEQCPRCRRAQLPAASGEFASFVEETRGHPNFSRLKVARPKCAASLVTLSQDPDDPFDTYISYPIEVTSFQAQSVTHIYPGTYHVLALTERGSLFSWGLLRHGRCGHGKFDPDSAWSQSIGRTVHDKDVPAYSREVVFDVTVRGSLKVRVSDPVSWYVPSPRLIEAFAGKVVVAAAAAECHSAAITMEGQLFTWGVARHGRLGTFDPLGSLLVDPQDPEGRYRALPAMVPMTGPDPLAPRMAATLVACTCTTTFVVAQELPDWVRGVIGAKKGGSMLRRWSRSHASSAESGSDTDGDTKSQKSSRLGAFGDRLRASLPKKLRVRASGRAKSEGSGGSSSPRSGGEGGHGKAPSEPDSVTIEDDYGNIVVVQRKSRRVSMSSEQDDEGGNDHVDSGGKGGAMIRSGVKKLINTNRLLFGGRNNSALTEGCTVHTTTRPDSSKLNASVRAQVGANQDGQDGSKEPVVEPKASKESKASASAGHSSMSEESKPEAVGKGQMSKLCKIT